MSDPSAHPPSTASGSAALFKPRATTWLRVALLGVGLILVSTAYAVFQYYRSDYWTGIGFRRRQPVMFSHRHHAGELGLDCRYCHATVETAAFAGMPSTHTCLTCHSQLFTDTPMLRPVVTSSARDEPVPWIRIGALPDHVHFDHRIHVAKGVGCTTCHGDVGAMPLVAKAASLTMRWCIDCHRDPAPHLRPREEIFAPTWRPPENQEQRGRALAVEFQVRTSPLTNCSTCHY